MLATEFKDGKIPDVLVNCIKESISGIFSSIFGSQPVCMPNEDERKVGEGVVGIISFVGDVTWLLMLALPRTSAESIALKFTGFGVEYDSPDMGDVVGELNNVLAGDIVARLSGKGIKAAMSLPTIMRGHDVEPLLPRGVPAVKMHYSLPEGEVFFKLAGGAPGGQMLGRRPGT